MFHRIFTVVKKNHIPIHRHLTATSPVPCFYFALELFRAQERRWNPIPIERSYFYMVDGVADYSRYAKEKGKSSEQILKA